MVRASRKPQPHEEAAHAPLGRDAGALGDHGGPEGEELLGEGVVPAPARDLLHQVDLLGDVGAEAGDGDPHGVGGGVHLEADGPQQPGDLVAGQLHPQHLPDPRGAQLDDAPGERHGVEVERPRLRLAPGDGDDEPDHALQGAREPLGVHPPLEAVGGVGGEPQPARGAADGVPVEERALDQEVGRAVGHLAVLAAHDAGEGDHAARRRR